MGQLIPLKQSQVLFIFCCAFCFYRPSNVFHQENKKLPDTSHDATCFPMTEDFSLIKLCCFQILCLFYFMPYHHPHGLNWKSTSAEKKRKENGQNNCCCCQELKKPGSWNIYLKWLEDCQGFCWSTLTSLDFRYCGCLELYRGVYKMTSIATPAGLFVDLHIDWLFDSCGVKAHRLEKVLPNAYLWYVFNRTKKNRNKNVTNLKPS